MSILIRDGQVLTPEGFVEGYVLVADGRVASVGAGAPPPDTHAAQVLSARHAAVLPGLVNAHTHLSQTFMRGLGGGRPLMRWLKERIWRLQAAMSAEQLHLAALLGLVENLHCGATQVTNHHKVTTTPAHSDAICQAALAVPLRLTLARAWVDCGANAEPADEILADLARLFDRWHGAGGTLAVASGPLATWRCSAGTMQAAHTLAVGQGSFTHIHVAETRDEVEISLKDTGLSPVQWLESLGVLDGNCQVVHAVWVEPDEIDLLARSGALVVHCPISNAVLGSGIAPVARLLESGVRLRLGTDGPASNDTQDIWEVLKTAVQLARVSALDPTVLPPAQALGLALSQPAVTPGMPADLAVVNLDHARAMPVHEVDSALVFCTHGTDVRHVLVAGRPLLVDGVVTVLDEPALLAECRQAAASLRAAAGIE
ncbi:MAG: amidohydrolase [Anaerolineae bacterium]|nr:amidohydrolase [Anaerolineae bacterium]